MALPSAYFYCGLVGIMVIWTNDWLNVERLKSRTVMVENIHFTIDKRHDVVGKYDIYKMGGSSQPWLIEGNDGTLVVRNEHRSDKENGNIYYNAFAVRVSMLNLPPEVLSVIEYCPEPFWFADVSYPDYIKSLDILQERDNAVTRANVVEKNFLKSTTSIQTFIDTAGNAVHTLDKPNKLSVKERLTGRTGSNEI